jgi:hypothetical protein
LESRKPGRIPSRGRNVQIQAKLRKSSMGTREGGEQREQKGDFSWFPGFQIKELPASLLS